MTNKINNECLIKVGVAYFHNNSASNCNISLIANDEGTSTYEKLFGN